MISDVIAGAAAGGAVGSGVVALLAAIWQRHAAEATLRDQAVVRAHASFLAAMTKLGGSEVRTRMVGTEELRLLTVDPRAGDYAGKARRVLNSGLADYLEAVPTPGLDGPGVGEGH